MFFELYTLLYYLFIPLLAVFYIRLYYTLFRTLIFSFMFFLPFSLLHFLSCNNTYRYNNVIPIGNLCAHISLIRFTTSFHQLCLETITLHVSFDFSIDSHSYSSPPIYFDLYNTSNNYPKIRIMTKF